MARTLPVKGKTVHVRSNVNVGGLAYGQMAEVDDNQKARDLIAAGLWTLLVKRKPEQPVVETPVVDEVAATDEG